jgi:hypothetical protein
MFRKMLLLLLALLPFAGCGIDWLPDGTKPHAFSFTTQTGVQRSTPIESNTVTITGNSYASTISVANGEYKIDDGSFTSTAGKITAGQKVTVKHPSASTYGTATTTTLTIGGVSGTFTSVTVAAPIFSNISSFSFATKTDVDPGTLVESDPVTITGTNFPWPISVTNGEYSIDAAAFTSVIGTITNRQSVKVHHTSASTPSTTTTTTLTIGTANVDAISAGFSSITKAAPAPFSNFSTPTGVTGSGVIVVTTPITATAVSRDSTSVNFSVSFTAVNSDINNAQHNVQFVVAGLNAKGQKVHSGYFAWQTPVPSGSSTVSQSFSLGPQQIYGSTLGAPAVYDSIKSWIFRQITVL